MKYKSYTTPAEQANETSRGRESILNEISMPKHQ